MALIHCPECNKEISDKATSCPNCGFPLNRSSGKDNPLTEEAFTRPDYTTELKQATAEKKDSTQIVKPVKAPLTPKRILSLFVLSLFIFPFAVLVLAFLVSAFDKGTPNASNPADRYSWSQYLTKTECDGWGTKGAGYGASDRLAGNYDSGGKKRMATSNISLSDNRLSEIWTCFETGYDTAYYQRY